MVREWTGTLGERVMIERWVPARDAAGDDVGAWAVIDTAAAAVMPEGGLTPAVAGDAARTGRRWRVHLRWRGDIGLDARLRWDGWLLSVRAVNADRRGDALILLCEGVKP